MQQIRILLVEDAIEHQHIFKHILTENRSNVCVDIADTGEQFIAQAKDAGISCFLVDFNLPDGSAGELLERASTAIGDRPVIVMSASNDQSIVVESFRHGGCDFVSKDQAVEGDYLWQRIEKAIAARQEKREEEKRKEQTIKELLRQGETDALTGLNNRHYFMRILSKNSAIRARTQSLGCIMLDLDYFKKLNDTYGHAAGDRVLKAVARAIRPAPGSPDIALRWGGEEFVIFHAAETLSDCVIWADALRRRIGALKIINKDQELSCTASMGVVHRTAPRLGLEMIDLADQALYMAKNQGRDCICTWDMVCVERRLSECAEFADDSPIARRARFIQSCLRTLGPHQLQHLTHHCEQVSRIGAELAALLNMSDAEIEQVRLAGLFHDIGKSFVPECLIGKPAALSPLESKLVERHVEESSRIGQLLGLNSETLKLVGLHHERYNAARPDDLPLGARVLCVADAMAAMLSDRAYRNASSPKDVMDEMVRSKGSQFDPVVVDAAASHADHWQLAA